MEKLRASHLARPRMRNAHDVVGLLPGDFFATQEQTALLSLCPREIHQQRPRAPNVNIGVFKEKENRPLPRVQPHAEVKTVQNCSL
jgi:hypothetical protein